MMRQLLLAIFSLGGMLFDGDNVLGQGSPAILRVTGTLPGHEDTVLRLAFAPDGKYLASAGYESYVRLWDVTERRSIATMKLPYASLSVAFSPDGKLLATGGGGLRLWSVPDCEEVFRSKHERVIWGIAFPPDGRSVATAASQIRDDEPTSDVIVWDVAARRRAGKTYEFSGLVYSAQFSPEGEVLALGGEFPDSGPAGVLLLNLKTGEMRPVKSVGHSAYSVSFSPDGKTLAVSGEDLCLCDCATGEVRRRIKTTQWGPTGWDVTFSPDGKMVAWAGDQSHFDGLVRYGVVRLWDVQTGRLTGNTFHLFGGPLAIAFSPDGRALATGGAYEAGAGFIRLWSLAE